CARGDCTDVICDGGNAFDFW
nr:immunoglobulin heavy chain junction region [Macaca mulatta]MOW47753.1 immunoglobulin heavy chain junction region [Macaca mulatta]MOW47845.1 immunoglobulin heavy chain junction region [Macaca mulatta]MOW48311.1 immunoglobulin heavy chain junction region [Macaca mulatta]MOW48403.1 immunoglobulin heavy chain junction region [Macaca mulatta]